MARNRDSLLARALLEARLKTDPQVGALLAARRERAGTYSRERSVNASNARGIQAATREATPDVRGAFDQALASVSAQRAALGQQSDPQAFAFERRVGEERANALRDLSERSVRAEEGRVYANSQARSSYMGDKEKIQGALVDLLGQRGALTASRLSELEDDESKAAAARRQQDIQVRGQDITARGQDIASRDRRAAQQQRAASKSKGPKLATVEAHSKAKDSIDEARNWIARLSQGSSTSTQIRDLLATGGSIDVGRPEPLKVPKFSKDFINAAYDLVEFQALSKANVAALHRRRLSIKRLGYATAAGRGGQSSFSGGASTGASGSANVGA